MRKAYLLFILFPIFSFGQKLEGQKLIDSLLVELPMAKSDTVKVNINNLLAEAYKYSDIEQTFKYGKIALDLSKKIKFKNGISNATNSLGLFYMKTGDYVNALKLFNKRLQIENNPKKLASTYLNLGNVYYSQSDLNNALTNYFKSLKINEKYNNILGMANASGNIANIYMDLTQYNKAMTYYKKSLAFAEKLDSKINAANAMYGIAQCYSKFEKYDDAMIFYQKALVNHCCPIKF